jgi:hypothetical protein
MSLDVRDVITRAMRLNGSVGSGDTPTSEEMADCLEAFNTLKRSWFGTLIGGRLTQQQAYASVENGGEYVIPALTAATLNTPAGPRAGARFGVVDATLSFATYHCTIIPQNSLIEGAATPLVLSTAGDNRRWWYRGDTANWVREADWTDPSNAIEFPDALIAYMPYLLAVVIAPEFNTEIRQDVLAGATQGMAAMARAYAPRGRNEIEGPLGVQWAAPAANAA